MGTPKQLSKYSIREMSDALALARKTAMDFRSFNARVKTLEHLRIALLPMVEWLDKPTVECFPGQKNGIVRTSTKRGMPFFGQFGTLHSVALEREGNWITVSSNGHVVSGVSSEWLTSAISFARHDILCSAPWSYKRESLSTTESMGMKDVVEHCAFLKYLGYGMEALDKTLTEREERLRIMRGNLSFLVSFVGGIDPMEYGAQEQVLAGYSLFYEHPRGHCRSLGTYFVRHPVEKAMQKRNNERHDSDHKYVVFSESSRFGKLEQLLTRVCSTLEEISEKGQFGRDPISPEEVDVIKKFTEKIGVPSS